MGELIAVVSFIVAAMGALATIFLNNRDKQTMASVVAAVFLGSFFVIVNREAQLLLKAACIVAFIISVTGGAVAIFSNEENKRTSAMITGIVSLGTSLFILFSYLAFNPF